MIRKDALSNALAEVLHAVPLRPPLSELSVFDVVSVDTTVGMIKQIGESISSTSEITYAEAGFFDKHLVECGQWSAAVAINLQSLLGGSRTPVDLAITDEEVLSTDDNLDGLANQLKPRTGVVIRVVTGRLDALCERCEEDAEDAEYLTNDESLPLIEVPVYPHGVIGAEVLYLEDDGKLYRLTERLFDLKSSIIAKIP